MCVGAFFVAFKSNIRPRGTKSEAAAVIKNRGHKKNQATSVSSGPCPEGGSICEDSAIFDAGRQREENKKEKTQFIIFSHPYKTHDGSKKKGVSLNVHRSLGILLSKIPGFYNESCWAPAPAPLIGYLILFPEAPWGGLACAFPF